MTPSRAIRKALTMPHPRNPGTKMSKRQLAKELGVNTSMPRKWEDGTILTMRYSVVKKLKDKFGIIVSPEYTNGN